MTEKPKFKINTVCPECGCGLIEKMTPDQYVAKYGETTSEAEIKCPECGKVHKTAVHEEKD